MTTSKGPLPGRCAVKFLICLTALLCAACARHDEPTVVLYASADEHIVREVIRDFERQTGITVLLVGDTEVKKTTGLVDRLRSEKDHPQADVLWSSEVFLTIALAEEGVLEPHLSPFASGAARLPDIRGSLRHRP